MQNSTIIDLGLGDMIDLSAEIIGFGLQLRLLLLDPENKHRYDLLT
jgi:hypothetical protein